MSDIYDPAGLYGGEEATPTADPGYETTPQVAYVGTSTTTRDGHLWETKYEVYTDGTQKTISETDLGPAPAATPKPPTTTPPATTDTGGGEADTGGGEVTLTPEQEEALKHDTDPDNPNTVDYEPIYDDQNRITGYNMYVDGVFKQVFDYSRLYEQLDSIEKPGTFQSYLDENGYEITDPTQSAEYQGLTALIAKLQDPNTTAENMQAGTEQYALSLGYGSAQEYLNDLESRRNALGDPIYDADGNITGYTGIAKQQGLSDEERSIYQEATRSTIEMQKTTWNRTLDAILSGATGNSTRNGLLKSRDFIMQIRDTQIQADMNLNTMDCQRKLDEFNAQKAMYDDMVDRGQVTREQYMNAVAQNRQMALQGYATQLSTILAKNEQYLSMYSADLDRIRLAADQVYATVQAELNIGADQREAISATFNQYWAEIMAPLLKEKADLEIAALDSQAKGKAARTVLGVLALIAGVCLMFVPIIGPEAGGAIALGGLTLLGS